MCSRTVSPRAIEMGAGLEPDPRRRARHLYLLGRVAVLRAAPRRRDLRWGARVLSAEDACPASLFRPCLLCPRNVASAAFHQRRASP